MRFIRVTLPPTASGRLTVELFEDNTVMGIAEFSSFVVMGLYAKLLSMFLEAGAIQAPFQLVH